jgi:hypothetical protein
VGNEAARLNQGLLFAACIKDIERRLTKIQKRLTEAPTINHITPVGERLFLRLTGWHAAEETGSAPAPSLAGLTRNDQLIW